MSCLTEYKDSQEVANMLFKTKHYNNLGEAGVFLIVQMCKTLKLDPMEGLNSGMWANRGKIEMHASLMNALIRRAGHSVVKKKTDYAKECVLVGTRKDNRDTIEARYSWDDAVKAGLSNQANWKNHTQSMLFARALSLLARQLFPDVIKGCYVEGEVSGKEEAPETVPHVPTVETDEVEEVAEKSDKPSVVAYENLPEDLQEIEAEIVDRLLDEGVLLTIGSENLFDSYMSRCLSTSQAKTYEDALRFICKKENWDRFLEHYKGYVEGRSKEQLEIAGC